MPPPAAPQLPSPPRALSIRFQVTRLGWVLLATALFLYGASLTSQSSLLLLLVGLILGCTLTNAATAFRCVRALQLEPPPVAHLAEGQRLKHPWRIANSARHPASLVQLESPLGLLGQLPFLAPLSSVSLLPEFTYWKRGVFPNTAVTISSTAPFGLIQARRHTQVPGEIIVHPALYETPAPRAAGYDAMVGGRYKGRSLSASGAHFHGVRPIQPGDPLRQIHWKASAKGHGLMVKTFEEELSGRVALLLDTATSCKPRTLDDAVRAAGSLAFSALDEGHHVEWVDLGRLQHFLIPPFADGSEFLDLLARVEPGSDPLSPPQIAAAATLISPRSAICLILTTWNEAALQAAVTWKASGRSVTLYLPQDVASGNSTRLAEGWPPCLRYSAHGIEAHP